MSADFDFEEPASHQQVQHAEERFEDAIPVRALPAPARVENTSIVPAKMAQQGLPHSLEAEQQLLGSIFADQDASRVLTECLEMRLSGESFYDQRYGKIFAACAKLHLQQEPVDIARVAEILKRTGELDAAGGYPVLMEVSASVSTTLHSKFFLQRVRELALQRELIRRTLRLAETSFGLGADLQGIVEQMDGIVSDISQAMGTTVRNAPMRALNEFAVPVPGDSSILLGNRYLNRGDGAVLSSTSGMGKSSMSLQMAILWALGMDAFGIKPNGPMRSLVVQSEDSDGDVAEIWASIVHVLKLTPEQIADVSDRVKLVSDRINRGTRFVAALKKQVAQHKPDLVWINPLQAFIDGDVTDSQDLGKFLREDLNYLNTPAKFAYVLVHHTTKPATGKEKTERQWHEVMYDMAGGAEIINWARAIMSLRPDASEGEFNLVLAKRGRRAGVRQKVDHEGVMRLEPTNIIPLKHASGRFDVPGIEGGLPIIFWETRTVQQKDEQEAKNAEREEDSKYPFSLFRNCFPRPGEQPKKLPEIGRAARQNAPVTDKILVSLALRWVRDGLIESHDGPGGAKLYRLPN